MSEEIKLFYMPVNWPDYHADTTHLDCCEHGAYFLLLGRYWMTQKPLPDDDYLLAKFAKSTPEQWQKIRPVIQDFFTVQDNEWFHKRVDADLTKAKNMYASRKRAAEKTNKNKKKNTKKLNSKDKDIYIDIDKTVPVTDTVSDTVTVKDLYNQDFIKWWNLYPLKVGKRKAAELFSKKIKSTSLDALIAATNNYIITKPKDQNYCHPTTYLNQDRFEDFEEHEATQTKIDPNYISKERLKKYKKDGTWYPNIYGPKPESEGCEIPLHILKEEGFRP